MNQFLQILSTHSEVIEGVGALALLAGAQTMPKELPYTPQRLWDWAYNFTQELLSMRSGKIISSTTPKEP